MPRYDYRCQAGHQYELQQSFGSPTEHECQKCGKPARRIVTVAPPLIFKAQGYYKTSGRDFKADSSTRSSSPSSSISPKDIPPKGSSGDSSKGKQHASRQGTSGQSSSGQGSRGKASAAD